MPFTTDEAKKLERIMTRIEEYEESMGIYEQILGGSIHGFDKLYTTGGRAPDYDSISDEELVVILRFGKGRPELNNLPDEHPYSVFSMSQDSKSVSEYSRDEMIETIDTWLESINYKVDPLELSAIKINVLQTAGRGFSAEIGQTRDEYRSLKDALELRGEVIEEQPELLGEDPEQRLLDINARKKAFINHVDVVIDRIGIEGARLGFEALAQTGGTAEEVAARIDQLRIYIEPSNLTLDISHIDLTGLDLSQSDLTCFTCDPAALSKAEGVSTVKGVSEEDREDALMINDIEKNITKLEAQLDHLREKPNLLDRIKAIRHGGIEGALERLRDKIDVLKEQLIVKLDPELATQLQTQNQETLKGHQQQGEQALEYLNAKRQVEGAVIKQRLNESFLPLTEEQLQEVEKLEKEGLEKMEKLQPQYDEYMKNEPTMEKLRTGVSVRERLGISSDQPKTEGPSQGHGRGVN
jgi:hypothetical protein